MSLRRSENKFPRDRHYQYRLIIPRKRIKIIETSPLVVDQLKSVFRHPGDFIPRMRTHRNWRPEYLIKFFHDTRYKFSEALSGKNLVPEISGTCSNNLHSNERNSCERDDLSNIRNAMKKFKKHFNTAYKEQKRRVCNGFYEGIITCKYWIARFIARSSLSTAVLFKENINHQIDNMVDNTKSIDAVKSASVREANCHFRYNQYEYTKEKNIIDISKNFQSRHIEDDCFFMFESDYLSMRKDYILNKYRKSCVSKKDVEVQTSLINCSKRKKFKRTRSKLMNEEIFYQEKDNESILKISYPISAEDFSVGLRNKMNKNENSKQSVQFLENSHAEYINKLTAVNRQIEEITATLREQLREIHYSERNLQNTLGKREKCVSPISHIGSNKKQEAYLKENDEDISMNFVKKEEKNKKKYGKSQEWRYYKKTPEKSGEIIILENIKKRIDRDFDEPSLNDENETEAFLTVSQKSSNMEYDKRSFYQMSPEKDAVIIKESQFTPLITSDSLNLDSTEIHESLSIETISEYSNKSSAPSKYFSCTRFSSVTSLRENEDLAFDEQSMLAHDLCSNLYSSDNFLYSNLASNANSPDCSLKFPVHKSTIEMSNDSNDTIEISKDQKDIIDSEICKHRYLLIKNNENDKSQSIDIQLEKKYIENCTLENSKSSKYIGSIDSGVFLNSSLIDLHENYFDGSKSEFKEKRYVRKPDGLPPFDFSSDNSNTDYSLNRKVDDVVRDLTKNLILCERRVRMKLKEMRKAKTRYPYYSRYNSLHNCKFNKDPYDVDEFFNSFRWSSEDENIISISTPSLLSLSDPESENNELNDR